jgi:hypothetical protein
MTCGVAAKNSRNLPERQSLSAHRAAQPQNPKPKTRT